MDVWKHKLKSKFALSFTTIALILTGCNDSDDQAPDVAILTDQQKCEVTYLQKAFSDSAYQIIKSDYFKKGETLKLSENNSNTASIAVQDVCVAKILVASETNPTTKDQPSYSQGIGIEVWLPNFSHWDKRIRVKGGGGWAGGEHTNPNYLVGTSGTASPSIISTQYGSVSATTDTGHKISNGSFAMNPDGTINEKLWQDFAERGIHEMAVVTKKLTQQYYDEKAKYAYWDGFSTGGRQGLKEAQINPDDFDGILAGAPAINWTKFITSELYPQIVMQRDLEGNLLSNEQLNFVSNRANQVCGLVNSQDYGYILDPSECRYDPTQDAEVLCDFNHHSACLTLTQAKSINKIWYGQTEDGSVPDPQQDNSFNLNLAEKQRWYGLTRGTNLTALAGENPFQISSDLVALILEDGRYAQSNFIHPLTPGMNLWKTLSYADLNQVQSKGLTLQEKFSNINTDQTDLSAFKNRNGKLIIYHGMADTLIMPQGTLRYLQQLNQNMGENTVNSFVKAYFIPGMGHSFSNGTSNPNANVALPDLEDLFKSLTDWVEKGIEPSHLTAKGTSNRTLPICVYPQKITYISGDINLSSSYQCH